jgi:hypothetical protein
MSEQVDITFNVVTGSAVQNTQQLNDSLEKTGQKAQQASMNYKLMATSIIGLGTGALGLVESLTSLERTHIRLEQATQRATVLEHELQAERLKGQEGTQKYADQMNQLGIIQQQISLYQERYNEQMLMFGTSIANTVVSSITAVGTVMSMLKTTNVAATVAQEAQTAASVEQAAALPLVEGGAVAAAGGIRAMTAAAWGFVATPIGVALLAIGAGLAVWESNLGNLRGTIEKATNTHLSLIGAIQSLGKNTSETGPQITSFNDELSNTSANADSAGTSLDNLSQDITSFNSLLPEATTKSELFMQALANGGGAHGSEAEKKLSEFHEMYMTGADKLKQDQNELMAILNTPMDTTSQGFRLGLQNLIDATIAVGKEIKTAGGNMDDFYKSVKNAGDFAPADLQKIQDGIDKVTNSTKAAAVAMEDLKKKRLADIASFNKVVSDISRQTGAPLSDVAYSFITGHSRNTDWGLDNAFKSGTRNFGDSSTDPSNPLSKFDLFGGIVTSDNVGMDLSKIVGGVNISGKGVFHDMTYKNNMESMGAYIMVFGSPFRGTAVSFPGSWDSDGIAADAMNRMRSDPMYTKFDSARGIGLYIPDEHLSPDENIRAGADVYDKFVSGFRADLQAEYFEQSNTYDGLALPGFANSGYVSRSWTTYKIPQQFRKFVGSVIPGQKGVRGDQIRGGFVLDTTNPLYLKLVADSLFATEQQYQNLVDEAKKTLGIQENDVNKSLASISTRNDIQNELDFQRRQLMIST